MSGLLMMDRSMVITLIALGLLVTVVPWLLGVRWIPNDRIGVIEKLWSGEGSLAGGRLIALDGEAGYQADVLRGGIHFGYWPWQYRVHKLPLTAVSQGRIGYVFARDGEALTPEQTLGRVVPCNNFQNAEAFLRGESASGAIVGQRGRQRAMLREGVYAINLAQFIVITEDQLYHLDRRDPLEQETVKKWHAELQQTNGFRPIVIGAQRAANAEPGSDDCIGIMTVHDGPSLPPGELIAPAVGTNVDLRDFHDNYQDIEAFLRSGGRRGRQLVPIIDGTYFVNRWFATVEIVPKTVVPIGHVGVVVSYYGKKGLDLSGAAFRHGELVSGDARGVQSEILGPGKYAFNTYAGCVHLVPTVNFVLHWITGRTESHRYDETLKSVDIVTADAYEPVLPLSVVVHIDYQKAPHVIQRFGDVKKLITQTLDPLLSAYFRDIAHTKNMLALLHDRHEIQREAREALKARFCEFDIELVDVLIGKPDMKESQGGIETLLDQLRQRQLAREQMQTYDEQRSAADKLRTLKLAQAQAEKQTELTNSLVDVEIASNHAEADLQRARKQAEQTVVTAEAESKKSALLGDGESKRVAMEGQAEAQVLAQKVASFGDARLYALAQVAAQLAHSEQPLVPSQLLVAGNGDGSPGGGQGMLSLLLTTLLAEKVTGNGGIAPLELER